MNVSFVVYCVQLQQFTAVTSLGYCRVDSCLVVYRHQFHLCIQNLFISVEQLMLFIALSMYAYCDVSLAWYLTNIVSVSNFINVKVRVNVNVLSKLQLLSD